MRLNPLYLSLPLLLGGCDKLPTETLLTGTVLAGPGVDAPLGGATLTVLDEQGVVHDSATSEASGAFEVMAPSGDVAFVDVAAPSHVTASFMGVIGLQDVQAVEVGTIFGFPDAELDAWHARYAGCEALGSGGTVLGEVRVWNLLEPGTTNHPSVATANVVVVDRAGKTYGACYLDAEGEGYDPGAVRTGGSGTFAIGGVPAGSDHTLVVRFYMTDEQWLEERYPLRVTDGGIAPQFPAWVEWPM